MHYILTNNLKERKDEIMTYEENKLKQMYGKLRKLFEEVRTMRHYYDYREMTEALEEHPDFIYFVNNYLEAHKGEDFEEIVKKAFQLLYSEEPPSLTKKEVHRTMPVPEVARETMEVICTRRLIQALIRSRVELVIDRLANNTLNMCEFAACGFDRYYIETMVRTVKLFSPTVEIKRDMIQDRKVMRAIIDRVYEELYVLTKRQRMWTCDWLDFESLRVYEGGE